MCTSVATLRIIYGKNARHPVTLTTYNLRSKLQAGRIISRVQLRYVDYSEMFWTKHKVIITKQELTAKKNKLYTL